MKLFIILPNIYLKENDKKIIKKDNNKAILIKLSILIMMGVNKKSLSISYKFFDNKIIYNKALDKIAKLLIIDKIKKTLEKKIELNVDKKKSSKTKDN